MFLKRNLEDIDDEGFVKKYSSLYTNMDTEKRSVYLYTCMFCIKRFIIGFSTIFANHVVWINMVAYMVLSLATIAFFIRFKPMNSTALNKIELFNESFIYISSFFFLIYSDWFDDIEMRYDIGFVHMYLLIAAIIINLGFIGYEMYKQIKANRQKKKWHTEWQKVVNDMYFATMPLVKHNLKIQRRKGREATPELIDQMLPYIQGLKLKDLLRINKRLENEPRYKHEIKLADLKPKEEQKEEQKEE
jgi:hypothetical protein